jgi:hypothetical protein
MHLVCGTELTCYRGIQTQKNSRVTELSGKSRVPLPVKVLILSHSWKSLSLNVLLTAPGLGSPLSWGLTAVAHVSPSDMWRPARVTSCSELFSFLQGGVTNMQSTHAVDDSVTLKHEMALSFETSEYEAHAWKSCSALSPGFWEECLWVGVK